MDGRRRFAVLGALALLLTGTAAEAQWRDGGWRERGGGRRMGGYAPGPGGYGGRGGYAPGGGYGGYGGFNGRYGFAGDGGGPPTRGYGGGGGGNWRRGQVLPPAYRDAYLGDPGRYRLRAPPNGYGWVGDGRNAYLTQRSTGMVLEAVPGAYDPAPRPGRGRRPR